MNNLNVFIIKRDDYPYTRYKICRKTGHVLKVTYDNKIYKE